MSTNTSTRKPRGMRVYEAIMPFAYSFLLDNYGIEGTPKVFISNSLEDCLARIEPYKDEEGNDSTRILVSRRLIAYYDFDEVVNVVKHELVHYALAYQGKNFRDGEDDFENELERLGLPTGGDMNLRGKVYIYSCNYQHNEVELHRTKKRTNVDQRICPICKHPMKYKGVYMIDKNNKTKIGD